MKASETMSVMLSSHVKIQTNRKPVAFKCQRRSMATILDIPQHAPSDSDNISAISLHGVYDTIPSCGLKIDSNPSKA